jgi:hypothetical protein
MTRILGPLGAFLVLIFSGVFAILNDFQKVRVDLGFVVAIVGLILGMLLMLLVGLDSDLKVRTILHDRLREEAQEEDILSDEKKQIMMNTVTEEIGIEAD